MDISELTKHYKVDFLSSSDAAFGRILQNMLPQNLSGVSPHAHYLNPLSLSFPSPGVSTALHILQ